jgi:hypothetical protein
MTLLPPPARWPRKRTRQLPQTDQSQAALEREQAMRFEVTAQYSPTAVYRKQQITDQVLIES